MASLTETVTPQGVVAVIPVPALPWPPRPTLVLVCDAVRDPGNLGTLLRAAAGAGVDGVLLPKGNVDVWSAKVLRAGMGAHFRLPLRAHCGWGAVARQVEGLIVRLAEAAGDLAYDRVDWTEPSALVVGGEAAGASREAAQLAAETIAIPLANDVESLNAAMAGSIILFEAQRQRRAQHET
ncbi:MAG: RNA methyltransferase [Ardenticatenaceae bacterium]|nr:RNA methyltransferase [Ardenticatenaceae bacterium]